MDRDRTLLILVDVQDGFAHAIPDWDMLLSRLTLLISGLTVLSVPVLVTEQVPEKLGTTVAGLSGLLPGVDPISKTSFSCMGSAEFQEKLRAAGVSSVIVAGVEAHVCVYQTVRDLCAAGVDVCVPYDAVSSRVARDRDVALETMRDCGARIVGVEMVLTDLLKDVSDPLFRPLLKLLK